MELYQYLKSVLDEDKASVVICNLEHEIIYMNPASVSHYEKFGGKALLGKNLLNCHNDRSQMMIKKVIEWFKCDKNNNRIFTYHSDKENKDVYMIALRDGEGDLIGYYEKHEYRNSEAGEFYKGIE